MPASTTGKEGPDRSTRKQQHKSVIQQELGSIIDNFTKLIKASGYGDILSKESQQLHKYPGELQEVYAEKMLLSAKAVLEVSRALQVRALLSDVERRNQENIQDS